MIANSRANVDGVVRQTSYRDQSRAAAIRESHFNHSVISVMITDPKVNFAREGLSQAYLVKSHVRNA